MTDTRPLPPVQGDERAMLDFHRSTLAVKYAGGKPAA